MAIVLEQIIIPVRVESHFQRPFELLFKYIHVGVEYRFVVFDPENVGYTLN